MTVIFKTGTPDEINKYRIKSIGYGNLRCRRGYVAEFSAIEKKLNAGI